MPNKLIPPISKGLFADLCLGLIAIIIGILISFSMSHTQVLYDILFVKISIYLFGLAIGLSVYKTWQSIWRWTSADDLFRLFQAIIIATIFYVISMVLLHKITDFYEPLITLFVLCAFLMGARGFARLLSSGGDIMALRALFRPVEKNAPVAILVGATDAITSALHELRKIGSLPFKPLAIVSTSGNHINKMFAGARVYDGANISDILEKLTKIAFNDYEEVRIILVGDYHSDNVTHAAFNLMAKTKIRISRMPEYGSKELMNVNPAEVLGRRRQILDETCLDELLRNKTVLITGAGGTIGSEIVMQTAKFRPSKIILLDSSENNLYTINQLVKEKFPNLDCVIALVDVREKDQIDIIFKKYNPHLVFHAAANKHVPLLESNPREAILVNLGGTKNVADAAMKYGSDIFVLISTDKAVNPSNMMGAAKRAAEIYVRSCFEEHGGHFYSVRFGNVLGSSGSVMPLFERQISQNGPVTITNLEMTRWFMTVEEAAGLVLHSAALGAGVEKDKNGKNNKLKDPLLVLDMGDPMRIIDFAEAMIRLRGLEPYRDIKIIETGIRPGEKLHEELFYPYEKVTNTSVKGIMCAKADSVLLDNLNLEVEQTIEAARNNNIEKAVKSLVKIVPEFIRNQN